MFEIKPAHGSPWITPATRWRQGWESQMSSKDVKQQMETRPGPRPPPQLLKTTNPGVGDLCGMMMAIMGLVRGRSYGLGGQCVKYKAMLQLQWDIWCESHWTIFDLVDSGTVHTCKNKNAGFIWPYWLNLIGMVDAVSILPAVAQSWNRRPSQQATCWSFLSEGRGCQNKQIDFEWW